MKASLFQNVLAQLWLIVCNSGLNVEFLIKKIDKWKDKWKTKQKKKKKKKKKKKTQKKTHI